MSKEIVIIGKVGKVENVNVNENNIVRVFDDYFEEINKDKLKDYNVFCVFETNKTMYVVVFDRYIIDSISSDAIKKELYLWREKARDYNYERFKHLIDNFLNEFKILKKKNDIVGIFRKIKEVFDYLREDAEDYINSKRSEIEEMLRKRFRKNENIKNFLINRYKKINPNSSVEKFQISLNLGIYWDELWIKLHLICYSQKEKFWVKSLEIVKLSYDEIGENIDDIVYKKMLLESV